MGLSTAFCSPQLINRPTGMMMVHTWTYGLLCAANRPELLALEKRFRKILDDQGKLADYKLSRDNFEQGCRDCSIKSAGVL